MPMQRVSRSGEGVRVSALLGVLVTITLSHTNLCSPFIGEIAFFQRINYNCACSKIVCQRLIVMAEIHKIGFVLRQVCKKMVLLTLCNKSRLNAQTF